MKRRSLLTLGGSLLGASVAGCLADPTSTNDQSPRRDDGSPAPVGGAGSSTYPEFPDDVVDVVDYDEVDVDAADAYLEPSARTVGRGETLELTLYNQADDVLDSNFYAWRLFKRVDGTWYFVAPDQYPVPLMGVQPGASHTWSFTAVDAAIGGAVPRVESTETLDVPALGGGEYLFGAPGGYGDQDQTTMYVAGFDLDAGALELTPSNAVESVEWSDDVLVATSSRGDPDGEYARLGAYVLRRVAEPSGDPWKMVPEQVVRDEQLRDALALSLEHDADVVRLEEYTSATPVFGTGRTPDTIEYDGTVYEIEAREAATCGCG